MSDHALSHCTLRLTRPLYMLITKTTASTTIARSIQITCPPKPVTIIPCCGKHTVCALCCKDRRALLGWRREQGRFVYLRGILHLPRLGPLAARAQNCKLKCRRISDQSLSCSPQHIDRLQSHSVEQQPPAR